MALISFAILMAAGIAAALIGRPAVAATALMTLLAAHVGWIVLGDQTTSEDSTAQLVAISAVYIYTPALLGLTGGLLISRAARSRNGSIDTQH